MKIQIEQPDWKLLREQKQTLLKQIEFINNHLGGLLKVTGKPTMELFEGLVNLIDNIQDSAVAQGVATELEVFGKTIEQ